MKILRLLIIISLLALPFGASANSLLTSGKFNKIQLMYQFEMEGHCDGCMAEYYPGPLNIFETGDNSWCNAVNQSFFGTEYRSWSHLTDSEWVGFTVLLIPLSAIELSVESCNQDWNIDYWGQLGDDDANGFIDVRGAYNVGIETGIGSLQDAIDPYRGQPQIGDLPNYSFALNFDPIIEILEDFNNYEQQPWFYEASPWEKVSAAASFWYNETQDECARWSLAHALVCYQSCNPGWDCGSSEINLLPSGFPEWEYDWQEQPTFLFYLYQATAPYVELLTVPSSVRTWDSVKAMYR